MQIRSIGLDLGKTTFHLVALGMRSQVVARKKFSRSQLLHYTANLSASLIGMEAGVEELQNEGWSASPPAGSHRSQTWTFRQIHLRF